MKSIILATSNKGKLSEFNNLAKDLNVKFIMVDMPDIIEDGKTFEENALKKAKTVSKLYNMPTLSDDSGLEIYALNNMPGIHTARYRNDLDSYEKRANALINELNEKNKDNREARFVCVLCLYMPSGEYQFFKGIAKGKITQKIEGRNGHGYDPIFYSYELKKSFGHSEKDEKNKVSHRAKAFEKLSEYIKTKW